MRCERCLVLQMIHGQGFEEFRGKASLATIVNDGVRVALDVRLNVATKIWRRLNDSWQCHNIIWPSAVLLVVRPWHRHWRHDSHRCLVQWRGEKLGGGLEGELKDGWEESWEGVLEEASK